MDDRTSGPPTSAPEPPRFLRYLRWLTRGLFVAWALYSFLFIDREGQWAARGAILAPALVPIAIAEYLYLRAKERAALAAAAARLGRAAPLRSQGLSSLGWRARVGAGDDLGALERAPSVVRPCWLR